MQKNVLHVDWRQRRPGAVHATCGARAACAAWFSLLGAVSSAAQTAPPPATTTGGARIERPALHIAVGARCMTRDDGTLGGVFGPSALPMLAFTIGPGSAMADPMHASKARFTGPGRYADVIVAVYLGKTATEDAYGGLGTVVVNADNRTGTFALNDRTASGRWDCGSPVR